MTTCSPTTCAPETASVLKPRYSIVNDRDRLEVRVELPGVRKDGVKISLDQGVLTIHGQRRAATPESWRALHRELSGLGYALRLKVGVPVEESKLSAKLEDGVLVLTLPVKEAARPRTITVQ